VDESVVVDDGGGLPQTVSVENSFRRGTIVSERALNDAMTDLYRRLPRLLKQRQDWAHNDSINGLKCTSTPRTIRLTIRYMKEQASRLTTPSSRPRSRRPFETRTKQTPIDGVALTKLDCLSKQEAAIRRMVAPLLQSLLRVVADRDGNIDVTKVNIGVTNFSDPDTDMSSPHIDSQSPLFVDSGARYRSGSDRLFASVEAPAEAADKIRTTGPRSGDDRPPTTARRKRTRIDDFFLPKKRKA